MSYNPDVPWGWNDGALWQGRGVNTLLSGGLNFRLVNLELALAPELTVAQNSDFEAIKPGTLDYDGALDRWRRPLGTPWTQLGWGQSRIRWSNGLVAASLGTQNVVVGFGTENSILLGTNAAGFPHFDLSSDGVQRTSWGDFGAQLVWGSPTLTSGDRNLYSLITVMYSPPETGWLTLGFSRAFSRPFRNARFEDSLSVLLPGNLFQSGGADNADQQVAAHVKVQLSAPALVLYGELARNDSAGDLRDLLLQPDHSLGYTWGLQWRAIEVSDQWLSMRFEQTDLGNNVGTNIRPTGSWYRHSPLSSTNDGQLLGASIGPGSNSQTLIVEYGASRDWSLVGRWQRIAWDVDHTLTRLGLPIPDPQYEDINRLDVSFESGLGVHWSGSGWEIAVFGSFLKELNRNWVALNDLTSWRATVELRHS